MRSERTYGARRVWHDVLEQGQACGLHHIERLMRDQALLARPRRRGLTPNYVNVNFAHNANVGAALCASSDGATALGRKQTSALRRRLARCYSPLSPPKQTFSSDAASCRNCPVRCE
ncbi:transposase [Stenotrophomonas pavanii]|nr:transposase [Stenotrophomonas pavanii]